MTKQFFDRQGEKRSFSGAKTRLFNEVYRKIEKSECKFIYESFLNFICIFYGTIKLYILYL